MAKFQVGDKVRILDASKISDAILLGFETGGIYDVIGLDECERLFISSGKAGILLPEQELQYIVKVKNNQRITALEKEVAELRAFKELAQEMEDNSFHDLERIEALENRIEQLEQAVKKYFTVHGEPQTVEDKPKTQNELRAEIIEKAKVFVDENSGDDYHFEIDEKEGQILAWKVVKRGVKTGLSTCHHNEVFNEDIGRAIAFGRAENLDVSEFEQAIQPTEVVVGMVIQEYYKFKEDCITEIDSGLNFKYINEKLECYRKGILNHNGFNARIINDTNAIY